MLPTIEWKDDVIVMIDQRKLPASEVYVTCKTAKEVAKAITTMVIRGAPAIGVAAAMGIALGMRRSSATGTKHHYLEFRPGGGTRCESRRGDWCQPIPMSGSSPWPHRRKRRVLPAWTV